MQDKYRVKSRMLSQRCHQIQRDNDRLIDMLSQTRRMVSRLKRQQQVLMKRLSRHEPGFRTSRVPLFTEVRREPVAVKPPAKQKRVRSENGKEGKTGNLGPKKPMNPYLLFCQMNRTAVQEEQQLEHKVDMNNQELTKALAVRWKFLTQDQKELYYKLYEQEKERYDKEMKLFVATSESSQQDR